MILSPFSKKKNLKLEKILFEKKKIFSSFFNFCSKKNSTSIVMISLNNLGTYINSILFNLFYLNPDFFLLSNNIFYKYFNILTIFS
jgi:hypothetical protein